MLADNDVETLFIYNMAINLKPWIEPRSKFYPGEVRIFIGHGGLYLESRYIGHYPRLTLAVILGFVFGRFDGPPQMGNKVFCGRIHRVLAPQRGYGMLKRPGLEIKTFVFFCVGILDDRPFPDIGECKTYFIYVFIILTLEYGTLRQFRLLYCSIFQIVTSPLHGWQTVFSYEHRRVCPPLIKGCLLQYLNPRVSIKRCPICWKRVQHQVSFVKKNNCRRRVRKVIFRQFFQGDIAKVRRLLLCLR